MEQKVYEMFNQGMLRDTSISKRDNKHAYENFNIRITANDKDTLLTITNERGHIYLGEYDDLGDFKPSYEEENNLYYLGHCVVEDNVIVFYHSPSEEEYTDNPGIGGEPGDGLDYIIKYNFAFGDTIETARTVLFKGNLNFDVNHHIETLGQVETNQVKKVYWVDGKNITRVINFYGIESTIESDGLYYGFDFMPAAYGGGIAQNTVECDIVKSYDGSGYMKPGTIQYFLTLYHKMGTETGVVWASPLCYPSFEDRGGSPEETVPTKFSFTFINVDPSFDYARLYAYGRSSENSSAFAYIVDDVKINSDGIIKFIDNGSNNTDIDTDLILFLGGQEFIASTLVDKNGKLFLGNIEYAESDSAGLIQDAIDANCFVDKVSYKSNCVRFYRSIGDDSEDKYIDIHPDSINQAYPYTINLSESTNIKGFKRGNKYRFGAQFIKANGSLSRTYWIGDAIAKRDDNIPIDTDVFQATVLLPQAVIDAAVAAGFNKYRIMFVKPSVSDRLIIAQGVINPSVFNIKERYYNRIYAQPSWVTRPFNSSIQNSHLQPIASANTKAGEIQNLIYDEDNAPTLKPSIDKINIVKQAYRFKSEFVRYFFKANILRCWLQVGYVDGDGHFITENSFYGGEYIDTAYFDSLLSRKNICVAEFKKDTIKSNLGLAFAVYPKLKDKIDIDFFLEQLKNTDTFWLNTFNWENNLHIVYYYIPSDGDLSSATQKEDFYPLYDDEEEGNHYCILSCELNDMYTSYIDDIANAYFVDNSIVTFNSPDTSDKSFDNDGYKFRLIGLSKAANNTFSYDINTKTSSYSKFAGKADFKNTWEYTNYDCAIVNAPLWYGASHSNVQDYNIQGEVDADSKTPYYIYMWQTNTSIENYSKSDSSSDATILYSDIDTKLFANRYYGGNTMFFQKYYDCDAYDIVNTFGNSAVNVKYNNSVITFANDIDRVIPTVTIRKDAKQSDGSTKSILTNEYNVYTGQLDTDWQYNATGGRSLQTSTMRYIGGENVVVSLKEQLPIIGANQTNTTATVFSDNADIKYLLHDTARRDESADITNIYPIVEGENVEISEALYKFLDSDVNIDIYVPYSFTKTIGIYDTCAYIQKQSEIGPTKYYSINTYNVTEDNKTVTHYTLNIISNLNTIEVKDGDKFFSIVNSNIYVFNSSISGDFIHKLVSEDTTSYDGIDQTTYGVAYDETPYLYIGEIYRDESIDTDFGGTSQSALNNNVFIPCSSYSKIDLAVNTNDGDTYYQRYDALRTKPYSDSDVNQVVDICSVMLATYTNLDGRYDTKRYTSDLLTIDWNNFAPINYAYSSDNNVITGSVLDDRYQNGDYSSSIVHSLVKEPNSLVDTWSNVTLASIVGLDSDKGPVNKLTKYANNIYAFQDKAIEQILYDERTQITPSIGVPVEIANSATVSHYMVTDMYGSKHKRSIVTAKSGLYFYDYNNGVICSFGEGIQPISTIKGFDIWVREHGDFTAFYDKRHGDIYFLTTKAGSTEYDTLCYNEYLGEFTSFYKYSKPKFMFNLYDHWMSYNKYNFWVNNEDTYGNIYNEYQGSSIEFKVTPNPYGDKLFTNINYRTDFFNDDTYKELETFSSIRAKDEYQESTKLIKYAPNKYSPALKTEVKAYKKFRIWNMDIPRMNTQKMDRFRNPWIQIKLAKDFTPLRYEFHNANVIYYE